MGTCGTCSKQRASKRRVAHAVSHSHGPPIQTILKIRASLLFKPKKLCIEDFGQLLSVFEQCDKFIYIQIYVRKFEIKSTLKTDTR